MNFTKLVKADLDFPCRGLSNSGPGIAVALSIFLRSFFCARALGGPIQL